MWGTQRSSESFYVVLRIRVAERGLGEIRHRNSQPEWHQMPKVLHTFAHTSSSIHLVRESVHSVMKSPQCPAEANGFRIISGEGVTLYEWSK